MHSLSSTGLAEHPVWLERSGMAILFCVCSSACEDGTARRTVLELSYPRIVVEALFQGRLFTPTQTIARMTWLVGNSGCAPGPMPLAGARGPQIPPPSDMA